MTEPIKVSRKQIRGVNQQRKHWLEYSNEERSYGSWRITFNGKKYFGFGVYLMDGSDAWSDPECATETEEKARESSWMRNYLIGLKK